MKKILFVLAVLFSTGFCFARDYKDSGFIMNYGGSFFERKNFNVFNQNNYGFWDTSFNMEFGGFDSAEDGLIDFVSCNVGGLNFGAINTQNHFYFNNAYSEKFVAESDADLFRVYDKESVGIQVNLFCFSIGWLGGIKIGLEGIKMNLAESSTAKSYDYYDGSFFVDFCSTQYVSLNIGYHLKLFLQSNIDYNIMNCRYIYTDTKDYLQTDVLWEFFKGEYPATISFGICFF